MCACVDDQGQAGCWRQLFLLLFSRFCEFGLVNAEGGDWWAFDVIWVTILCLAFAMSKNLRETQSSFTYKFIQISHS